MIAKECFSKEWVLSVKERYPLASQVLLEKAIHAFELLGLLVQSKKPFVFKGGTSLVLLLPAPKRLSIDLDVIGDVGLDELKKLVNESVFTGVEEDERPKSDIPKRHFKISYSSNFSKYPEYVLLDTLNAKPPYPRMLTREMKSGLFKAEQQLDVTLPSINGILGDKLTAFAPETIGVPFGKERSMEIIKQLFDIGELFTACSDLNEVRDSYHSTFELENGFRGSKLSLNEVLDDTIRTAYAICRLDLKGSVENEKTNEIRRGITQIGSYLLQEKFSLLSARVAAARASYLASLIKYSAHLPDTASIQFDQHKLESLASVALPGKLQSLTKLRSVSPECFYYWSQIAAVSDSLKQTEL
jgi:hypothetical protein